MSVNLRHTCLCRTTGHRFATLVVDKSYRRYAVGRTPSVVAYVRQTLVNSHPEYYKVRDSYLERLELESHGISFRDGDLPDALLVGLVVVRIVGTGENARLLADLSAAYRYHSQSDDETSETRRHAVEMYASAVIAFTYLYLDLDL